MGEKAAKTTGSPKALYVFVVIIGLLLIAGLVYAFWLALRANPANPWESFAISQAFLEFRDIILFVGAVLWLFGTLLFALELAGFTITKRGISRNRMGVSSWGVIDVALAALSAAVYGGLLAATTPIVIVPGFTWLRPANSLAPLFGMFFGIPGCLGVAFGNLIADIVGGYFGVGSFGGFIGNFLIAYLPYKMVKDHSFASTSSIGEFYLWGVIVQAFYSAIYICRWLDVAEGVAGLPVFVARGSNAPTILL